MMTPEHIIAPCESDDDTDGAYRVFNEFRDQYQTVLAGAQQYFTQIMETIEPTLSKAYLPWQQATVDLLQGTFLVSRKIPLKDPKKLADAMRLFSLESSIDMLRDICLTCHIHISAAWHKTFEENLKRLGEAFRILNQHVLMQQQSANR